MDGTVLVADDDRTIRTVLTQALTRAGCRVHATASLATLRRWVGEGRGDLVISDVVMPDGNGLETLPDLSRIRPGLPVIVISAQNTIMTAIRAAENEAYDYLPKPFDLPDLMQRVARALARQPRVAVAQDAPPGAGGAPHEELPLVGRSAAMQTLYRLLARVMNAGLPVLVTGESGTGKSLVARVIHDCSDRRDRPLVRVTPEDLLAPEGPAALIAGAGRGTLLFDGVNDLDRVAQARVARMLDSLPDPGPAVVATCQGAPAVGPGTGEFREDLYYRLAGVTVPVPALRQRPDDIPALAEHFLARAAGGAPPRRLSAGACEALRVHRWPGNVRELENTIRRLAATGVGPEIGRAEAEAALDPGAGARDAATEAGGPLSAAVAQHLGRYFALHGGALPPPGVYQRVLREVEVPLIGIALDATGGNQAKCAALLGINRNTLRKKLTELGIEVTRRRKLM
ncbi:MAG: nitrogen regulation protein NR(I) [Rhodobacterales bacterium]|nr:MAG: nitrogen regulation protein NR(I) [Rhodobacterales bacterium]